MTHRITATATVGTLAVLAAAPALAADPVAGARYAGETSQAGNLRFEFRVSDDGSRVRRALIQFRAGNCENARSKAQGSLRPPGIGIVDGTFERTGKEVEKLPRQGAFSGGTQIERYRVRGRFPTSDRAKGTLRVRVEIRDRQGNTISTCRHNKRITWKAARLGVGPDYQLPVS
ncbi:MAG TPA: hypothetical protein VE526_11615 [Solirubrobacteraceae bacterium]|jgi:hypothetical protein|nr:hypothetical protein [Solirubrobacteraceae bacterium]